MSYTVEGYTINYDGGLSSSLMIRRENRVTEEHGVLLWTSYHRNNAPNTAGPNSDNSWTQVARFVIPGGVGNNEIVTHYYKIIQIGAEPTSYTLARDNGSGNESTVATIARVVGVTQVMSVNVAWNFGNTSDNIAVPAGGIAYYTWGSALDGGLQTPTPAGLTHVAGPISHPVGAKMQAYYQQGVASSGSYTGSFDSGADHNATVTSTWGFDEIPMRLTAATATADNTITVALPPVT